MDFQRAQQEKPHGLAAVDPAEARKAVYGVSDGRRHAEVQGVRGIEVGRLGIGHGRTTWGCDLL